MDWTDETILAVWKKGTIDPDYDSALWRNDAFGRAMRFQDYGNRNSVAGWEIDHIKRVSDGGTDDLSNLRPLHWKSNVGRG